jgi:hypothetical protein
MTSSTDTRTVVSDAVFEKMLDGAVMRHLYRDPRYRNAENADEQAEAEAAIELEQLARLETQYRVEGV